MKWSRPTLIFEPPTDLPWARSHAALPIVEQRNDGLRLYFSSRDEQGRAHIGRAALDVERPHAAVEEEPVLGLGQLGSFDDRGVTSSCVVANGGRAYLYYSGWTGGVSVPFYFFGGCAISEDEGATFRRASRGPVLERNDVDPFLTASPWVLIENGVWRMWYVSCTEWEMHGNQVRHRYHIKYAESDDGIAWRRDGHVCIDYRDDDEYAIARPCVVRDGDRYRMWYSSRGDAYRIGYAESSDGLVWQRLDDETGIEPSGHSWDSEMQAYPVVFDYGGARHMLLNGNGYGLTGVGHALLAT